MEGESHRMFKILLVEDHSIVREGIKRLLPLQLGPCTFHEVSTGRSALADFSLHHWDIVLLDLALPDRSGLDVLSEMKARNPEAKILVLSALSETEVGQRVLKAGANGFLAKESTAEELVRAVRRVTGGMRYISTQLAEHLVGDLSKNDIDAPHEVLSDREYLVLKALGAGKSVTQIARSLCLSPKTISTYRAHVLRKLKVKTNADLIRYVLNHRLLD